MASMVRAHVWISGQVQGVGFRISTLNTAMEFGLGGWVKNLSDGRVEAVFEGDPSQVEVMIQWCHHGPPAAMPQQVMTEYEPPEGLQKFTIIR
ncbi:MAG: acylphosphatase [Microcoleaceae cyanobacterium]